MNTETIKNNCERLINFLFHTCGCNDEEAWEILKLTTECLSRKLVVCTCTPEIKGVPAGCPIHSFHKLK